MQNSTQRRLPSSTTTAKVSENLTIHIPSLWPSNLKQTVLTLLDFLGSGSLHAEILETPSLPIHAAMVSFHAVGRLPPPPRSPLTSDRDAYEWTTADGTLVIRGANSRSAAFAVFEVARRMGLRWLSWMREPGYWPELAEPGTDSLPGLQPGSLHQRIYLASPPIR